MSVHTNLKLEKRGHIAVVTLYNLPAHTWTQESLRALQRLVGDLAVDREVYSLVLTGEGRRFFSAGAELKLFANGAKAMACDMARCFGEAFETLVRFRGVSIAAINGYAMMELILAVQCTRHPDFAEGVRALLIDKDQAPQWQPPQLAEVSEALVQEHFTPPLDCRQHPLADL